ncbi:MAG: hypothetical protein GY722_01590 [bacterium]|nr:hypothetical protein [bacterium]
MKHTVLLIVAVLAVSACSEETWIVAEPDDITPLDYVVESTQAPMSPDSLLTAPDPLDEDGVRHLVSTFLPNWGGGPVLGGEMFCAYELYGWEQHDDVAEAWIWADCREYYVDLGALVIGTAGAAPMTVHLARTSNGWLVSFVDEAGMGGLYATSVREMFPPEHADKALSDKPTDGDLGSYLEHAARSQLAS